MERGGPSAVSCSMEDLVRKGCRAPRGKERTLNRERESARPVKASDCSAGRFQHLPAAARKARNVDETSSRGRFSEGEGLQDAQRRAERRATKRWRA
jgi:hypothetical protein